MLKKFEDIKTAVELMDYIAIHGRPTDDESICRMQDIIGHSTIEELDGLANNIGRKDENGNPNPKSWSGGNNTQKYFYPLIFSIWNWEDAARFWNQHTNPEHKEMNHLRTVNDTHKKHIKNLEIQYNELLENKKQAADRDMELQGKLAEQEAMAAARDEEIIRLKAKLYDLMTAGD